MGGLQQSLTPSHSGLTQKKKWKGTKVVIVGGAQRLRLCSFGFSSAQKNWGVKSALMKLGEKNRHAHDKDLLWTGRARAPTMGKTLLAQKVRPQAEQTLEARMRPPTPVLHDAQYLAPQRGQLRIRFDTGQPKSHIVLVFLMSLSQVVSTNKKKREGRKSNWKNEQKPTLQMRKKNRQMTSFFSAVSFRFLFGFFSVGGLVVWGHGVWVYGMMSVQNSNHSLHVSKHGQSYTCTHTRTHIQCCCCMILKMKKEKKRNGGKKK